jgi:hypothetical protein
MIWFSLAVQRAAVPFVIAAHVGEFAVVVDLNRKLFVFCFTIENHVPIHGESRLPFQWIIAFAEKHFA